MATLGLLLIGVGTIWIVINAFGQSVLWGLGSLFVPFVAVIFALLNFSENKIPIVLYIAGVIVFLMGGGLSAGQVEMPAEM